MLTSSYQLFQEDCHIPAF